MKNFYKNILTFGFAITLASCGIKYTPIVNTSNINGIDLVRDIQKTEKSCAYGLFLFSPFAGDISAISIAKENGISKINAIDFETKFYLLFNKTCTIVHGKRSSLQKN